MNEFILEIRNEFLFEAMDLLNEYQNIVENIEGEILSSDLDSIFRIIHTLKGNSQTCDFLELSTYLHKFESYLDENRIVSKIKTKPFLEMNLNLISELFNIIESLQKNPDMDYDYSKLENTLLVKSQKDYNILIVDDEQGIVELLELILLQQYSSSKITTFTDSGEALKELEVNSYDLVISDYNMPILTGTELLTEVRKTEINETTPFIFITGFKPPLPERSEAYDDVFFLEKPFTEKRIFYYMHCSLK